MTNKVTLKDGSIVGTGSIIDDGSVVFIITDVKQISGHSAILGKHLGNKFFRSAEDRYWNYLKQLSWDTTGADFVQLHNEQLKTTVALVDIEKDFKQHKTKDLSGLLNAIITVGEEIRPDEITLDKEEKND
jgi:hypothetical protein